MDITRKIIEKLSEMKNDNGSIILKKVDHFHNMNNSNLDPSHLYAFVEDVSTIPYRNSDNFQSTLVITFACSHSNADEALTKVVKDFFGEFNNYLWDNIVYCSVVSSGALLSIKDPVIARMKQVELAVRFS